MDRISIQLGEVVVYKGERKGSEKRGDLYQLIFNAMQIDKLIIHSG